VHRSSTGRGGNSRGRPPVRCAPPRTRSLPQATRGPTLACAFLLSFRSVHGAGPRRDAAAGSGVQVPRGPAAVTGDDPREVSRRPPGRARGRPLRPSGCGKVRGEDDPGARRPHR